MRDHQRSLAASYLVSDLLHFFLCLTLHMYKKKYASKHMLDTHDIHDI